MNDDPHTILLRELHKSIQDQADYTLSLVGAQKAANLAYPPGVTLSPAEQTELTNLRLSDDAQRALRKLLVDALSGPLFHMFSLMDTISEPENMADGEQWFGARFEPAVYENGLMLHDELFASYPLE